MREQFTRLFFSCVVIYRAADLERGLRKILLYCHGKKCVKDFAMSNRLSLPVVIMDKMTYCAVMLVS